MLVDQALAEHLGRFREAAAEPDFPGLEGMVLVLTGEPPVPTVGRWESVAEQRIPDCLAEARVQAVPTVMRPAALVVIPFVEEPEAPMEAGRVTPFMAPGAPVA